MAGENGSVEIPIKIINAEAIAQAKATEKALKEIDLNSEAKTHALELAKSLDKVESVTKQTVSVTNSMSASNKKLSTSEKQAAEAARKQITEQNNLKNSLRTSASYYDKLVQGMESANLKASSNVAKLQSVKAELGATKIETAQAKAEWERLSASEGENAASTLAAKNKFDDLIGTENKLTIETANLERQVGGLSPKMALSADKAGLMAERFTTAGERISAVGSKMTMGVTLPIVGGLTASTAAATKFDNEIKSMGALLDDGSVSSETLKSQLDSLGGASKKWSFEYGISTSSINDGMSELIKKGYTYNQTLGAMPSILDASKASGEDFNDVMSVSTSTLEQFGLKSNNTAKMLKNTQRVTDSLTFVANKTSAGFSDMGYAMQYVGPVAHGLGISLEQTSAMIGEMSNQGIEGQKAGTSLRGALTSLLNPSAQNRKGFEELGISVDDFKKGTLTMPDVLDKVKESTKNMTKGQKQAALALAFGTEAQSGMNILVSQGGDELRKLTKETQNATGYTHKLAETMNNTSKANVDKFKQSLHVLAITFGSQLMPEVTKIVKEGTKLVEWFSNLDEGTQHTIIKTLMFAASFGPVTSAIGKTSSGIGMLLNGYKGIVEFAGKGKSAMSTFSQVLGLTENSATMIGPKLATAGEEISVLGSGAEGAAGSAGLFGMSLGTLLPILGGVALALGAGYAAWKIWNSEAVQGFFASKKWGDGTTAAAGASLDKMQQFNATATASLNDFADVSETSGKKASKAFSEMGKEIEKVGKKANKDLTNGLKDLPANVRVIVEKSVNEQKKSNTKIINSSKDLSSNVASILKKHGGNVSKLTNEQRTYIENSQQKLNENELKLLGIGGKNKTRVMKALNGDIKGLTEKQAQDTLNTLQNSVFKEQKVYEKNTKTIKDERKKGLLTETQYKDAMKQLNSDHKNSLEQNLGAIAKIEDNYSAVHTTALDDVRVKNKLTFDEAEKYLEKTQKTHKSKLSSIAQEYGNISKVASDAGKNWNRMVLNPKTGKIKTNAQQTLNDTAKTEEGWNQLVFDAKHAKIDSNAKAMIGVAAVESGRWNKMKWEDKKPLLAFNVDKKGNEEFKNAIKGIKDWDSLQPKKQEAIITAKGKNELTSALIDAGEWNKLTLKEKTAMVKSKGSQSLVDMLTKAGKWNDLSFKAKEAVIKGKGSGEVVDQVVQMNKWNNLTLKEKQMIVGGKAKEKIIDGLIQAGIWNNLTMSQKNAVVKDKATANLVKSLNKSKEWDKLSISEKDAIVKDKSTANLVKSLNNAKKWNGIDVDAKTAIIQDKATAPLVASMVKTGEWNKLPADEKKLYVDKGNSATTIAEMVARYGGYDKLPDSTKKLLVNDSQAIQVLGDANVKLDGYNAKKVYVKNFTGNAKGVLNNLTEGETAITKYNGKRVIVKRLKGDAVQIMGAADQSSKAVGKHNKAKADKKIFKGDVKDLGKKIDDMNKGLVNYDKKKVKTKTFKANDKASGPAKNANSEVQKFINKKNHTVTLTTKHVDTYETKKKKHATGTNNAPGGPSVLGDGGRPEPYLMPSGIFGISPNTDTDIWLEPGSKVWSSISAFNSEIKASNSRLGNMFSYTPEQLGTVKMNAPTSPMVLQQGNNQAINELKELISKLANKDISINVNVAGETVLEKLYPLFKDKFDMDMLLQIVKSGGNANA